MALDGLTNLRGDLARYRARRAQRRRMKKKPTKKFKSSVIKVITSNSEKKFDDTQNNGAVDFSGAVNSITEVTQGVVDNDRDGDQLTLLSAQIRFSWTVGTTTDQVCRLIMFQWLSNSADHVPVVTDILQTSGDAYGPFNPYKNDTRFDYRVLYDTGPIALPHLALTVKTFSAYVTKFANRKVQFIAGGTTGRAKIYILTISNIATASNPPAVRYYARLRYTDH